MSRIKKAMYRRLRQRVKKVLRSHQVPIEPNLFWFIILLISTFFISVNNTVYLTAIAKSQATEKSSERILGLEFDREMVHRTRKMVFFSGKIVGNLLIHYMLTNVCSIKKLINFNFITTAISMVTCIARSQFVWLNFIQGISSITIEFLIRSLSWEKIHLDKQLMFNAMMMTVSKLGKIYLKVIKHSDKNMYLHTVIINIICSFIIAAIITRFKPNPQQNSNNPSRAVAVATSRPYEDKLWVTILIAVVHLGTTIVQKILKFNYFANTSRYYDVKGFDIINAGEIFLIFAVCYVFNTDYLKTALSASQIMILPCYVLIKKMVLNNVLSIGISYLLSKLICLITFDLYRKRVTHIYSIQKRKQIYNIILLAQSTAEGMWPYLDDILPFIMAIVLSSSTGFYFMYFTN